MASITEHSSAQARPKAAGLGGQVQKLALPAIVFSYILVLLIPIEFSVFLGSLMITPSRGYLLVVAVPVFILFLTRRTFRLEDGLLMAFAFWVFISFVIRQGVSELDLAGQRLLEILISYCIARTFITTREHVFRLSRILTFTIAALGLLAIPEAITHQRFLHEIPQQLTGLYYYISNDTRMGMLRAASTFEHPILFGLFAASAVSLLWFTARSAAARFWRTFFAGIAAFFSLSSAAVLVFGMQLMLILTERLTRRIKKRVAIFTGLALAAILFLELASNRGAIGLIAGYLTFSAYTAYYRMAQWTYTIDDIFRNPVFGLSLQEWTRPGWLTDSIDNHWLFVAFQNGIPAILLLWGVMLVITLRMLRKIRDVENPKHKAVELGWLIAILALFLGGWTVTFFGKMTPYFAFFLGLGSAIARMPIGDSQTDDAEETGQAAGPSEAGGRRYTRFSDPPSRRYTR